MLCVLCGSNTFHIGAPEYWLRPGETAENHKNLYLSVSASLREKCVSHRCSEAGKVNHRGHRGTQRKIEYLSLCVLCGSNTFPIGGPEYWLRPAETAEIHKNLYLSASASLREKCVSHRYAEAGKVNHRGHRGTQRKTEYLSLCARSRIFVPYVNSSATREMHIAC